MTDLTGTSWFFNAFSTSASNTWNINFYTEEYVSGQYVKAYWKQIIATSDNKMYYVSTDDTQVSVFYQGDWADDFYRYITITGGSQVSTSSLISWFQNNTIFVSAIIRDYLVTREETWLVTSSVSATIKIIDNTKTSYQALPTISDINNYFNDYDSIQLGRCFENCVNMITSPAIPNYQGKCTGYNYLYSNCTSLTTGPIISDTTSMSCSNMYKGCTALISPSLPANASNMSYCFFGCTSLTSIGVIPTSVTNMRSCFQNCSSLITVSNLTNCTSLTNMYQAFEGCVSLITMPALPNSVLDMDYCFKGCSELTNSTSLSNCTALTRMNSCFESCIKLTSTPNLSGCSSLAKMDATFKGCISLINALSFAGCTALSDMRDCFNGCTSLLNMPDLSGCTNLSSIYSTFYNCSSMTTTTTLPASITSMTNAFYGCSSITMPPNLSDVTNVTSMFATFRGCTNLSYAPNLDHMTGLTDLTYTFLNCANITAMPSLPNSVTTMFGTFLGCANLVTTTSIPTNVTDIGGCFEKCTSLIIAPSLDNCTALTDMYSCFNDCTNLITAPIIPSTVQNVSYCFYNCTSLTGEVVVNSNNITSGSWFGKTHYPIKITGSANDNILFELADGLSYNRNVYVNKNSSLNYSSPKLQNLTLSRCNQDGTLNVNGRYVRVNFNLWLFKDGLPNDIYSDYRNYFDTLTAVINGISNNITDILDENNQSYRVKYGDLDLSKSYHFIIENTIQTPQIISLQISDKFYNSTIKQAILDVSNVVNTYLKYQDDNSVKQFLNPVIPANNVVMLNSNFANINIYDIIWKELYRKE